MARRPVKKKGRINQGRGALKAAGAAARGVCVGAPSCLHRSIAVIIASFPGGVSPRGAAAKARNKRIPPSQGRRRGQGVITGLAARRPAALLKRGTLNRAAFTQVGFDPPQTGGNREAEVASALGNNNLGLKCWFSENETENKAVCSAPRRPVQEAGGAEEVVPAARATERPEPHRGQETVQASAKVRI